MDMSLFGLNLYNFCFYVANLPNFSFLYIYALSKHFLICDFSCKSCILKHTNTKNTTLKD